MSTREEQLAEFRAMLERQGKEIRSLQRKLNALLKAIKPPPKGAYIYPDCGYEWMNVWIKLDPKTWAKVKAGQHVKIKGKGWSPEESGVHDPKDEDFSWDYWEFMGGIGKPMSVYMKSPHDPTMDDYAYQGVLRTDSFEEFDP